jgi:hypothetical protein
MILLIDFGKREQKEKLYETLKGLKPTLYKIELKVNRDNRSNKQNRYYWGVVIAILSEFTGFTPDEMHYDLKSRFLKYYKVIPSTGEERLLIRSTSKLSTEEFEKYVEEIRRWAITELDVYIPSPNEYLEAA